MRVFLLLSLLTLATAHEPGAEYTYLSMFLKPPHGSWSDENAEYMRDTYVNDGMLARRRLHAREEERVDVKDEARESVKDDVDGDIEEEAPRVRKVVRVQQLGDLERELGDVAEQGEQMGEDLVRVGKMMVKLLKQYQVGSMVDVPCRAHLHWMGIVLKRMGRGFRYYCVDTNRRILEAVREELADVDVEKKFLKVRFWKEKLPKVDVVFAWGGLDQMKEDNVVSFVRRVRRGGGLVFIGSHSGKGRGVERFTGGGKGVNLRRKPFGLKKPMRIVGELAVGGNDKQLYIYKAEEMGGEEE